LVLGNRYSTSRVRDVNSYGSLADEDVTYAYRARPVLYLNDS